jgi:hypothetical protein
MAHQRINVRQAKKEKKEPEEKGKKRAGYVK